MLEKACFQRGLDIFKNVSFKNKNLKHQKIKTVYNI